ncbi:prolyl oligopeptidase, partial [Planctomicrobium sp.]|nr:prolyl oligopeptidase [Planctomicrobium sp.]
RNYATHIEKVVGGVPGSNVEVDAQLRSRSPINFLQRAKGLPIDLNAGIHDGHTGSVPISHTLIAFNALAKANDQTKQQISSADIREMTQKQTVPDALQFEGESEKRTHEVLLRRNAGSSRVTIFEGGHEGDLPTAIEWLSQQSRSR